MSYVPRAVALSLGAFFLVYAVLACVVIAVWQLLHQRIHSGVALFALRILPGAGALSVVLTLVIPSFLRLEPHGKGETLRPLGVLAASAGTALVAVCLASAWRAWRKARRFASGFAAYTGSRSPGSQMAALPFMLVTGIRRPRLVISTAARELLSAGEMRAAVLHEWAHVRHHDNLKKLFVRMCPMPLARTLERRWNAAIECRADDDAAVDERTALDLASALVKMASVHRARVPIPDLAASLLSDGPGGLSLRVERLLGRRPDRRTAIPKRLRIVITGAAAVSFALTYGTLLAWAHEIAERLFR